MVPGFNNGHKPWLPINSNYLELNLENQKLASESHFKIYKNLTTLKRNSKAIKYGNLKAVNIDDSVLAVIREYGNETISLLINFQDNTFQRVNLTKYARVRKGVNATVLVSTLNSGIPSL